MEDSFDGITTLVRIKIFFFPNRRNISTDSGIIS